MKLLYKKEFDLIMKMQFTSFGTCLQHASGRFCQKSSFFWLFSKREESRLVSLVGVTGFGNFPIMLWYIHRRHLGGLEGDVIGPPGAGVDRITAVGLIWILAVGGTVSIIFGVSKGVLLVLNRRRPDFGFHAVKSF